MLKKITYVVTLLLFLLSQSSFAYFPDDQFSNYTKKVSFLSKDNVDVFLDNGTAIHFSGPSAGISFLDAGNNYYAFRSSSGLVSVLTADGICADIQNNSNHVIVIKWNESSFGAGNYSGLPFLDGMKYKDAGNPSALPDTILAPGQKVSKNIYVSRVKYEYKNWNTEGELIPVNGSVSFILNLKILDNSGNAQYFSIKCPPIGIN